MTLVSLSPAKLTVFRACMHEDVIAHMRGRLNQLRKVITLADDPRMIEMIEKVSREAEADIAKMEADHQQANSAAG